ncbi:hypothetical protein GCM10022277_36190 [Litoribacillus peritrichatus]|uniref:Uncharacterized protein n=1 Tax=Litoribacillus peritrichatus TaxID=718191 RepID=A0ABP7N7J2_9GAMM
MHERCDRALVISVCNPVLVFRAINRCFESMLDVHLLDAHLLKVWVELRESGLWNS